MATVPNSDFTGSLAKFWFQVHNLRLLKILSPGTRKQHHSRNSELKNSDRVQMCVLDPSNAAFPLGNYQLLLVPFNHWVLGPQLYTHWHLASTSLLTLTIRRSIHPNIQSQSSRPWISGYPAPSSETDHKSLLPASRGSFLLKQQTGNGNVKRDRVLSFHCVALFSLLQGQNQ